MRRFVSVILAFLTLGAIGCAQQWETVPVAPDTLEQVIQKEHVLHALQNNIVSSDSLHKAMDIYIGKNQSRNSSVYRLRIFFDNSQSARAVSEQVVAEFTQFYPDVPVFRGYTNPYFKVTVGNFMTRSEAMKFLNQIKKQYPSVFLVRETFSTI